MPDTLLNPMYNGCSGDGDGGVATAREVGSTRACRGMGGGGNNDNDTRAIVSVTEEDVKTAVTEAPSFVLVVSSDDRRGVGRGLSAWATLLVVSNKEGEVPCWSVSLIYLPGGGDNVVESNSRGKRGVLVFPTATSTHQPFLHQPLRSDLACCTTTLS